MKVMWIVNTIFPYPAKMIGEKATVFGGWLNSLHAFLINTKDLEIAIATTYNGKELLKFEDGKTVYFLVPCKNKVKYDKNLELYWREIVNQFSPDLVHLHGTEYPIGLSFINACPQIKTVTSIQGLVSVYAKYYTASISAKDILKNITIRDIIKGDNILVAKKGFEKRGVFEKEALQKTNGIIGRTSWDYASTFAMTMEDKYSFCNESLRDSFYHDNWDIKKIVRRTIAVNQASYPIKGFHFIIEAISIIKKIYPDVKVRVAGINILDSSTFMKRFKQNGYAKYLKKLIKKYDVSSNIEFTGLLSEEQVKDELLKANVFVQASSIENSSNSLGEAMLLGVPCVASNVGGTSDLLIDKKEGFLYPYTEASMLANYILKIFNDDSLVLELSASARSHAKKTHDRKTNGMTMLAIYKKIINGD